jgi:hypothetical protein
VIEPKERVLVTGVSEQTKSNWIAEKRTRSKLKESRRDLKADRDY